MFEQLIYTSCKTGIKNLGTGFQVYSHSHGLEGEKITEITKNHCSYREPDSLPRRPSDEEIEELFPLSFKFDYFSDDTGYCFSRTKYIGRDYMGEGGRYGVFLTHALSIDADKFDHYPVEISFSDVFIDNLLPEEKNSDKVPDYLETVEKEKVIVSKDFIFDKVHDFLFNNEDYIVKLQMILDALVESTKTNKSIIICDDKDKMLLWFAAITLLLPRKYAKKISYDTYAESPQYCGCKLIGVYSEGTGYIPEELTSCYLFDFKSDIIRGASTSYEYSRLLCDAYIMDTEETDEFNSFLSEINIDTVSDDIDKYYEIFSFLRSKEYGNSENLISVIDTTKTLQNASADRYLYDRLIENVEGIIDFITPESAEAVLSFFEKVQDGTNETYSKDFFADVLLMLVNECEQYGENASADFYDGHVSNLYDSEQDFLKELFETDRGNKAYLSLENDNIPYHTHFYARKLFEYIVQKRISLEEYGKNSTLARRLINNTLSTYSIGDNAFAEALIICKDKEYGYATLKTFISLFCMAEMENITDSIKELSDILRKKFPEKEDLAELIATLDSFGMSGISVGYAQEYLNSNGTDFLKFARNDARCKKTICEHYDVLVMNYAAKLHNELDTKAYICRLADILIEQYELFGMAQVFDSIVGEIDLGITLEIAEMLGKEKLNKLCNIKKKTSKDRPGRIEALLNVLDFENELSKIPDSSVRECVKKAAASDSFKFLDKNEAESVARKNISRMCIQLTCAEDQRAILDLFSGVDDAVILALLTSVVVAASKNSEVSVLLDHFEVLCDEKIKGIECDQSMDDLMDTVYKLPKNKFELINREAIVAFAQKDVISRTWQKLYGALALKKSNTFGNKILDLFKGGKKKEAHDNKGIDRDER